MKALSLWQPWASLMADGLKTIETRGWATNYRGPLAIHAAKRRMTVEERELIQEWRNAQLLYWGWPEADLPYGAVIAVVVLVNCVRSAYALPNERDEAFGNYGIGRWAWITRNPRVLRESVPWRGTQGLFEVPDSALNTESVARVRP